MRHNGKAQLSLEYLLLLLAFFSVLLLLVPLLQRAYSLALFAFDSRNAVSFAKEFAETTVQLSVLSNNSSLSIEAEPLGEWVVLADGKTLSVAVNSGGFGRTKTITQELSLDIFFRKNLSEKTAIVLTKENGSLKVNSYP